MYISDKLKDNIAEEFKNFKDYMYGDKDLLDRKKLDQFFTPFNFTIETLRNYKDDSVNTLAGIDILDPCCGSGCLLASCIIAGADINRVYGNDYDEDMVNLCRKHLVDVCLKYRPGEFTKEQLEEIFKYHIHRGNALQKKCLTNFDDSDNELYLKGKYHYQAKYIDDLLYAQSDARWETQNREAKHRADEVEANKANELSKAETTSKYSKVTATTTQQEVQEFKVEVIEKINIIELGPKINNKKANVDNSIQDGDLFN